MSNTSVVEVEAECTECGATGLYRGFAEPEGIAVICHKCGGSGKIKLKYTPFTDRKEKSGVNSVTRTQGWGPSSVGHITYQEFLAGKMPT